MVIFNNIGGYFKTFQRFFLGILAKLAVCFSFLQPTPVQAKTASSHELPGQTLDLENLQTAALEQHNFAQNTETCVNHYLTISYVVPFGQNDLLKQTSEIHFSHDVHTMINALQILLRHRGYQLIPPQQLPTTVKTLNPQRLFCKKLQGVVWNVIKHLQLPLQQLQQHFAQWQTEQAKKYLIPILIKFRKSDYPSTLFYHLPCRFKFHESNVGMANP